MRTNSLVTSPLTQPTGPSPTEQTLGDLARRVGFARTVTADTLTADVIALVEQNPSLTALLVVEPDEMGGPGRYLATVTAEALARKLIKPFFRDVFDRKPLRQTLRQWSITWLELPAETPIAEAVQALLARAARERYEPVVVRFGEEEVLPVFVDANEVLLAQCRLLDSTVHELDTTVDELRQVQGELERIARHDPLTGLPNRRLFGDRLARAVARHRRDPSFHFAVFFLDFDRFKLINDSLGHDAGDELLRGITTRLTGALRDIDTLSRPGANTTSADSNLAARVGGDEFLVLLENLRDPVDAARVAERLLHILSQPYQIAGHDIRSTASIGITTSAQDYARAEDAVRDADTAMYRSKAAGRARYVMFDAEMHREVVERLTLENDLRGATDRREMWMAFQPIVDLDTGQTRGFESLLRWNHSRHGQLAPDRFIALAEETGNILPLGRWALQAATAQLARWRRELPPEVVETLFVTVNVSPRQLCDPELLPSVRDALAAAELAPQSLCLEVTESTITQHPEAGREVLVALRKLGVRLVLDDFGTGQSSLAVLHGLPFHAVKLDRGFVREIDTSPRREAVVRCIVDLAAALSLELVAEGVEREAQADVLRRMGCRLGQGYLWSRPANAEDAATFLQGRRQLRAAA